MRVNGGAVEGCEMKAPPGKGACLMMAKITYPRNQELSWKWLLAWGFYEMYVDGWYGGKA